MISPIGTFVLQLDSALLGAIDGITASVSAAVAAPLALAAAIYYAMEGFKLANGDPAPLHGFVPRLLRIGVIMWLATNMDAFNYYVRDMLFVGLPNFLGSAVSSPTGGVADINTIASSFDNLYAQMWTVVGSVWSMVSFTPMGVVAAFAGLLAAITGGLGLVFMGITYLGARMMLAVVICLAPALIACGIFESTRPFLERAIGKVVALVLLQVGGFILLRLLLVLDSSFMVQLTNASLIAMGNRSGATPDMLQQLAAMVVFFVSGAWALLHMNKLAYSIGTGAALPGPSMLGLALAARSMGGGGGGAGSAAPAVASAPGIGPISLSLAQPMLSAPGGAGAALPLPPPPSISNSTRS